MDLITPSVEPFLQMRYYPCLVTLRDGSVLDCVYLVSDPAWISLWGVYPSEDSEKAEVPISDVASLAESPTRLPAPFANELYKAGESGMGYMVFTVVFKGLIPWLHSRQAYITGNAVDFIDYPRGKGPTDVVSVLPHVGRNSKYKNCPKHRWCLYSE